MFAQRGALMWQLLRTTSVILLIFSNVQATARYTVSLPVSTTIFRTYLFLLIFSKSSEIQSSAICYSALFSWDNVAALYCKNHISALLKRSRIRSWERFALFGSWRFFFIFKGKICKTLICLWYSNNQGIPVMILCKVVEPIKEELDHLWKSSYG